MSHIALTAPWSHWSKILDAALVVAQDGPRWQHVVFDFKDNLTLAAVDDAAAVLLTIESKRVTAEVVDMPAETPLHFGVHISTLMPFIYVADRLVSSDYSMVSITWELPDKLILSTDGPLRLEHSVLSGPLLDGWQKFVAPSPRHRPRVQTFAGAKLGLLGDVSDALSNGGAVPWKMIGAERDDSSAMFKLEDEDISGRFVIMPLHTARRGA